MNTQRAAYHDNMTATRMRAYSFGGIYSVAPVTISCVLTLYNWK